MAEQFNSKTFLKTVTSQPGVYRMYDITGDVIYVGKAKDLKKRLSSYFRIQVSSRKTESLVKNIAQVDV
ncbi:GIY-YIG nuclease family protein, partial [Xenorhabdus bovienii]|uniref:GIY-YIG nuclease family protein n=1 Tax=Xenorhabdus bovienii TaxID=40576 RepID=UPI0023B2691D